MNGAIIEKEKEAGLRVIGLCELYGRRQVRGSEAAAHAQRMLLLYRLSYWRRFGRSATQDEVRQAMWRRAMEMRSSVLTNSCNQYRHEEGCDRGGTRKEKGAWDSGTFTAAQKKKAIATFSKIRKSKINELQKAIGTSLETPIPGIPTVKLHKSGIKEMLNNKALWSSMNLGASLEVHIEAVERTREFVKTAKPGRPVVSTDSSDFVKEKIYLDRSFTARDGKRYTARYMVRVFEKEGMEPDIYFVNCRK